MLSEMEAEQVHFVYTGGGREVIPEDATHVAIHKSISVISAELFRGHQSIVELICHEGVIRIEEYACNCCYSLKRVIMLGVKNIEEYSFCDCVVLTHVECRKLELIGAYAFSYCRSLSSIDLISATIVEDHAFNVCKALNHVTFGNNLKVIYEKAFGGCDSLQRITIPLKENFISANGIFKHCKNLNDVDLVEGDQLDDTIDALLLDEWRKDITNEIHSISQILPNTSAGVTFLGDAGRKASEIREWIRRVLRKIIDYKTEHRQVVKEAASMLAYTILPHDVLVNNVLPFVELPSYSFGGDDDE